MSTRCYSSGLKVFGKNDFVFTYVFILAQSAWFTTPDSFLPKQFVIEKDPLQAREPQILEDVSDRDRARLT